LSDLRLHPRDRSPSLIYGSLGSGAGLFQLIHLGLETIGALGLGSRISLGLLKLLSHLPETLSRLILQPLLLVPLRDEPLILKAGGVQVRL